MPLAGLVKFTCFLRLSMTTLLYSATAALDASFIRTLHETETRHNSANRPEYGSVIAFQQQFCTKTTESFGNHGRHSRVPKKHENWSINKFTTYDSKTFPFRSIASSQHSTIVKIERKIIKASNWRSSNLLHVPIIFPIVDVRQTGELTSF